MKTVTIVRHHRLDAMRLFLYVPLALASFVLAGFAVSAYWLAHAVKGND